LLGINLYYFLKFYFKFHTFYIYECFFLKLFSFIFHFFKNIIFGVWLDLGFNLFLLYFCLWTSKKKFIEHLFQYLLWMKYVKPFIQIDDEIFIHEYIYWQLYFLNFFSVLLVGKKLNNIIIKEINVNLISNTKVYTC